MQLSFLEPLLSAQGPWATVYFPPAHPDEAGAKRRDLALREADRTLEEAGADEATRQAVREALESVGPAEDPAGTVVFAAGGRVVLTHRLSRSPQRLLACWGPLPRLTPLLECSAQDPSCLVVYIDRTGADFELRARAGQRDAGHVQGQEWPVHRTASADWSERHFQLKVENTWEQNAAEIAQALTQAKDETGADTVVLVGDPRERSAVYERLSDEVREVTAMTEHGGRAAGSASSVLDEDIEQARQEHARLRVEQALDRFRAGRRAGADRPVDAVEGVPALVDAARQHRIGTLLVRPDGSELHRETWVGPGPDQLATTRSDALALAEEEPVSARADDALLRSAAATAADVLIVPPEAVAEDVPSGGLGAVLRWTYEPSAA